jgi:signal transduction histidine kinase/CheY-like chemotaxis protein
VELSVNEGKADPPSGPHRLLTGSLESLELLDLAQEAGSLGLFEWQVQEGTLRLSLKFLSLYGLTEFDGLYATWLKCIYREDVPRLVDHMDTAFSEQVRQSQVEFRFLRPTDGALRWIEERNIIFYDAGGRAIRVVGVNVDITERKSAIAQLRAFTETLEERVKQRTRELEVENEARIRVEEALRQAQKMEAVGQLTGGIAHDFNNLLGVIVGSLEMLQRRLQPMDPKIRELIELAMRGAEQSAEMTRRLLAFSRQQPLDPQSIEVNRLVRGMSNLLHRTLGENIAIETVLGAGLWTLSSDVNQLENALLNLAINARDAMPKGGKLTIETENAYLDEAYASDQTDITPGQYVMIAVTDTGVGMSQEVAAKAFEPFFTTKGPGVGTGLGLSQVYGFVKQSGGHVKIYSEVGEGTTVKLYLPRLLGSDTAAQDAARVRSVSARPRSETILIVEDNELLSQSISEMLREQGYRVLVARDGETALEQLASEPSEIHLLLTDVVLPAGMNGRKLAEEALRRWPTLKVLFMTGYARNSIFHQGRLDPGVNLIVKPFTYAALDERIRRLLD